MSDVQYDVEINAKLDRIDSQLAGVEKRLDNKFKSAGAKSGSLFGSAFSKIATSLIGAVSFAGLIRGAMGAVTAARNASTANQVLAGAIDAANQKAKDSNAILRSSTSSIEQKALAIGFDTTKIYENTKATGGASKATKGLEASANALEKQIRDQERAFDDQTKSIENNINALEAKKNQEIQAIRNQKGYGNLTKEQQDLEKELTDLEVQRLQAIKDGDGNALALIQQQIDLKKLDQDLAEAKIKQIDLQTNKVENLYEVEIKKLRAELDSSKNKFDIDIEPAKRKLEDLRDQIGQASGGGGQALSKSFKEALQKALEGGVKQIDKAEVTKRIDSLLAGIGKDTGLQKSDFVGAFSNLFQAGLTDIDEATKTVEGFIKIASRGNLPLAEGVGQLAEQFRNENAALGERAGLTDEYASQIGPRGLAILQAEGKLRGKNYDELSNEERALAKSTGLRTNIAEAQGVYNAKLKAGAFEADKQKAKLEELQRVIGEGLMPLYYNIINIAGPILDFLLGFTTANEGLIPTVFGLSTALAGLATIFGFLGGPVTLVVAAIIGALALLKYAWDNNLGGIQETVSGFIEFLKAEILPQVKPIIDGFIELLKNIYPIVKPFLDVFFKFFGDQINTFKDTLSGVVKIVRGVLDVLNGLFSGDGQRVKDGFSKMFSGFGDITKAAFNSVIDQVNLAMGVFNELGNSFEKLSGGKVNVTDIPRLPKLAQGGSIIPPGYNNDTFPLFGPGGRLLAMAQSGERIDVVPRNEVNNNNSQINSGNNTNYYNFGMPKPQLLPATANNF